jgi:hypothetical protein
MGRGVKVEITTMMELKDAIHKAIELNVSIGLFIQLPDLTEPELIINPPTNLKKKLEYYEKTYDNNLNHKHADGIKILAYVNF